MGMLKTYLTLVGKQKDGVSQMPILFLAFVMFLSACTREPSRVDDSFLGGVALSAKYSSITTSATTLTAGTAVTVTITMKDETGNAFYVPNSNPVVVFSVSDGTSTGTFGPIVDDKKGNFTTTFTGAVAGTPAIISATVDGKRIDSTAVVCKSLPRVPQAF